MHPRISKPSASTSNPLKISTWFAIYQSDRARWSPNHPRHPTRNLSSSSTSIANPLLAAIMKRKNPLQDIWSCLNSEILAKTRRKTGWTIHPICQCQLLKTVTKSHFLTKHNNFTIDLNRWMRPKFNWTAIHITWRKVLTFRPIELYISTSVAALTLAKTMVLMQSLSTLSRIRANFPY